MQVKEQVFGHLPDGQEVTAYTLVNENQTAVTALTYGATWQSFRVIKAGQSHELLVNFDQLSDYVGQPFHVGHTIGPVGGRLSQVAYQFDGEAFKLTPNDGPNVLHSGINGFDRVNWQASVTQDAHQVAVHFTHTFVTEFPGELRAEVTYTLDEADRVTITFSGQSTATTLFNPMTHVYFNFDGRQQDASQHELQIAAREHVAVDDAKIPTGTLVENTGTKFDLEALKPIGDARFDDAWRLADDRQGPAVILRSPNTDMTLAIDSDRNGVVVFTTNPAMDSDQMTAVAIEMQTLPDAVNHPDFGDIVLPANVKKTYQVTYDLI